MATGFLLPGFGAIIETEDDGNLLPGFGAFIETEVVTPPVGGGAGSMWHVFMDRIREWPKH